MDSNELSRRKFLAAASAGALAATASGSSSELAIRGGQAVRTKGWPSWPIWDRDAEEEILSVLRSGDWFRGRGKKVSEFEARYAELMGAKRCLATASGTTALLVALHCLGVDAGDEVLVAPYTFIATYNAVLLNKALPVFVDTDPETFTMDPAKIEERITEKTRAILPVHILGLPADMDRINAIARKHNLVVIEDACQAWLAEYRGKKCGTLGDLGCFSFQNSKNLAAGEGGAVIGNDETLLDRCHSFHSCGRPVGEARGKGQYPFQGSNYRMTESQAVILKSQMRRVEKDADTRLENALHLTAKIKDIPGIIPYKLTDGATRSAYHLYPFRYKKEFFNNASKERFLAALSAEGVPCSGGYSPQNHEGVIEGSLDSRGYRRLFSEKRIRQYREENHLPANDQLCQEAVWLAQSMLLAKKTDMDDIANAIEKIHEHRDQLA